MNSEIKLTELAHGAGCGCKIAPAVLHEIISRSRPSLPDQMLLVGNETGDDAAIYELPDGNCLVSTADFFMPIVDDAATFGRIAACNALSDVYAMGGKPVMALALMGFPSEKLPASVATEIMNGAIEVTNKAGVVLAGGHTIDSPEPFFGLALSGIVAKKNIRRNNTAKPGDAILLTKPLGTGILATAKKRKLIDESGFMAAIDSMCTLNDSGIQLATLNSVHAMTDVTGFGLIGHLMEMCKGSSLSATLQLQQIPLLPGVDELASKFVAPDNTFRNWNNYEPDVDGISGKSLVTLCDPQTNGGLLLAVDANELNSVQQLIQKSGQATSVYTIGNFTERKEKYISLLS